MYLLVFNTNTTIQAVSNKRPRTSTILPPASNHSSFSTHLAANASGDEIQNPQGRDCFRALLLIYSRLIVLRSWYADSPNSKSWDADDPHSVFSELWNADSIWIRDADSTKSWDADDPCSVFSELWDADSTGVWICSSICNSFSAKLIHWGCVKSFVIFWWIIKYWIVSSTFKLIQSFLTKFWLLLTAK